MSDVRRDWKTLAGRLDWVVSTKRVESERSWSEAAAGGRNPAQVNALKRRSKRDWREKGRETTFDWATIVKLAQAADVSVEWLGHNRGKPDEKGPTETRPAYPNLETAADLARGTGEISEAAIRAVIDRPYQIATDMPVLWWLDRMRAEQEQQRVAPALPPIKAVPALPQGQDASERPSTLPPPSAKDPRSNSHIAIARVHPETAEIAHRLAPKNEGSKKKRRDG